MAANQDFSEPPCIISLPGNEGKTFRITPVQPGLSFAAVYDAAGQVVHPGLVELHNMSVDVARRRCKTMTETDYRFLINQCFNYRVAYNGKIIFDLIVAHHVEHYE